MNTTTTTTTEMTLDEMFAIIAEVESDPVYRAEVAEAIEDANRAEYKSRAEEITNAAALDDLNA